MHGRGLARRYGSTASSPTASTSPTVSARLPRLPQPGHLCWGGTRNTAASRGGLFRHRGIRNGCRFLPSGNPLRSPSIPSKASLSSSHPPGMAILAPLAPALGKSPDLSSRPWQPCPACLAPFLTPATPPDLGGQGGPTSVSLWERVGVRVPTPTRIGSGEQRYAILVRARASVLSRIRP